MASLIDTNVLVYRVDPRDPLKQQVPIDILREGLRADRVFIGSVRAVNPFLAAAGSGVAELSPLYEAPRTKTAP